MRRPLHPVGQYSAPQFNGGCKGYRTGMYAGMLFCRSYGVRVRTTLSPHSLVTHHFPFLSFLFLLF